MSNIFPSLESIPVIDSAPIGVKFTTIEHRLDSFLEQLEDSNYTDHRIHCTIEDEYIDFLNYDHMYDSYNRKIFLKIWTNERFLRGFLHVLRKKQLKISMLEIICFNKIAYDYIANYGETNYDISNLFLQIASYMNRDVIVPLQAISTETVATSIAIAARSSYNEQEKVERLNNHLINYEQEFTVKEIIYIYSKFYMNDFSTLFLYTITGESKKLEEKQKRTWDNICSAIITILDSMPSVEILKVIKHYGGYLDIHDNIQIRIKLKSLEKAPQFQRIAHVIHDVEMNYGYAIP